MRNKLPRTIVGFLTNVWALFIALVAIGIALIVLAEVLHPEEEYLKVTLKIVEHVGMAFIVATLVGFIFHAREFSEFFTSLAKSTLIDDAFLKKLSQPSLLSLRARAASTILQASVTNETYDRQDLESWIDKVLFEKLLPNESGMSGAYREDMIVHISLEILSMKNALQELNIKESDKQSQTDLDSWVVRLTTESRFRLVLPRKGQKTVFPASLGGISADIPGFPHEHQVRYMTSIKEGEWSEHKVDVKRESGRIVYSTISFKGIMLESEVTEVRTKLIEHKSLTREPFVLNTMSMLTRNIDVYVHVSGALKKLTFYGEVFGLGRPASKTYPASTIHLKYEGWLLEDHGYFVWWWESDT